MRAITHIWLHFSFPFMFMFSEIAAGDQHRTQWNVIACRHITYFFIYFSLCAPPLFRVTQLLLCLRFAQFTIYISVTIRLSYFVTKSHPLYPSVQHGILNSHIMIFLYIISQLINPHLGTQTVWITPKIPGRSTMKTP